MPASRRLAILAVAAACLAPLPASALDEYVRAYSLQPTELELCGKDGALVSSGECKKTNYDALNKRTEKSLQAVLAKAPANIRPLLKRDQDWFNEMMLNAVESQFEDDEARDSFIAMLRERAATLDRLAQGFGRPGVSGRWTNTFGSIDVKPADGGYRLAIETRAVYGSGGDRRRECKVSAKVKPAQSAWLTGIILPDPDAKPATDNADNKSEPQKPVSIKLRRQGETLRVVIGDPEWFDEDRPNCQYMWQITGSYFGDGKDAAAADKADTVFVAPTLDCTKPESATEEEFCADPDLAENDQKLNRAWKALLPRLDETTRRALTEDQRSWVKTQTWQYPLFLHPAWNKTTSFMHFTVDARDKVNRLQKERIALLDGFDDKREGLAGVWLAYNAILKVTATDDGIKAEGWKWEQGDWKAGCDFDMKGKVAGGKFISEEKRKNPDTLERDHGGLIVNKQDDTFAKKRDGKDDGDEPKCRRNTTNSSTARLFPAKPSPDIDNLGGSIR